MQDHIFRMYDIRGIVGEELAIAQVADFARAFAWYLHQQDPAVTTIAVGMDGRTHSPAIKDELVRGLLESGLSVIFIGVCPTPLISFSEYCLPVQAACMITASHNPKEYNGIKLFLRKKPIFSQEIFKLRDLLKQKVSRISDTKGSYKEHLLIPEYVAYIKRLFPHLVGSSFPVVFDCANGAVGAVLPAVCQALELSGATILYEEVDGNYPHHEADPTVKENMLDLIACVKKKKARLGIGFDGDGDRMGAVTFSGTVIPGDQLLALFSKSLLENHPGATVVCDAKCSTALKEYVEKRSGTLKMSPSGHAFLRQAMEETGALLAGELSCHFFFHDRYFGYDDGIYAALRLLELLIQSKSNLEDLLKEFPHRETSPEFRIACVQGQGIEIVDSVLLQAKKMDGVHISTIDGVRLETDEGWGLLRASNTQPVICLRFEARSHEGLVYFKTLFKDLLKSWYDKAYLNSALD